MAGTALTVYMTCRRALRSGGYGFGRFCTAISSEYARVEEMQRPDAPLAARGSQPAAPTETAGPAGAWQWPNQTLRVAR